MREKPSTDCLQQGQVCLDGPVRDARLLRQSSHMDRHLQGQHMIALSLVIQMTQSLWLISRSIGLAGEEWEYSVRDMAWAEETPSSV